MTCRYERSFEIRLSVSKSPPGSESAAMRAAKAGAAGGACPAAPASNSSTGSAAARSSRNGLRVGREGMTRDRADYTGLPRQVRGGGKVARKPGEPARKPASTRYGASG